MQIYRHAKDPNLIGPSALTIFFHVGLGPIYETRCSKGPDPENTTSIMYCTREAPAQPDLSSEVANPPVATWAQSEW
jgi:hypothetical protein